MFVRQVSWACWALGGAAPPQQQCAGSKEDQGERYQRAVKARVGQCTGAAAPGGCACCSYCCSHCCYGAGCVPGRNHGDAGRSRPGGACRACSGTGVSRSGGRGVSSGCRCVRATRRAGARVRVPGSVVPGSVVPGSVVPGSVPAGMPLQSAEPFTLTTAQTSKITPSRSPVSSPRSTSARTSSPPLLSVPASPPVGTSPGRLSPRPRPTVAAMSAATSLVPLCV